MIETPMSRARRWALSVRWVTSLNSRSFSRSRVKVWVVRMPRMLSDRLALVSESSARTQR
ncbi:MAG: hypothetical protein OXL33_01650 [Chloroflexota bacterium]|nr:hypothetical protein [Chloroflexota bacterium]